jgi:hypothetical protein
MLDNSGASEQTLRTLKTEMGAVNSARAARRDIRAASMMLDVVQVLTGNLAAEYRPRDGEIPWTAETCDNADEKFDNKSYTKLGIGTTLLGGNASASDCETLLQQMGENMPSPDDATVRMAALTTPEKDMLEHVLLLQYMQALRHAATGLAAEQAAERQAQPAEEPAAEPAAAAAAAAAAVGTPLTPVSGTQPSQGPPGPPGGVGAATVIRPTHQQHPAAAAAAAARPAAAAAMAAGAEHDNILHHPTATATAAAAAVTGTDEAADEERRAKRYRAHREEDDMREQMDVAEGNRTLGPPSLCWTHSLLDNVHSKDHLATLQGLVAMEAGRVAAGMPVLVCEVDHEFYPTAITRFFLEKNHTMPFPAYGHEIKALCSGVLAWNRSVWSERLIEAMGITANSPAYAALCGGTKIRAQVKHVIREAFVLLVALARHFLQTHPPARELMSVFSADGGGGRQQSTETIVDPFGRAKQFTWTPEMMAGARMMMEWGEKVACGSAEPLTVHCDSLAAWSSAVAATPPGLSHAQVSTILTHVIASLSHDPSIL